MAENRGGPRVGKPGALYPNRSDMAATRVPPSKQYGQGVEQQRVLHAGRAAAAAAPAFAMPEPPPPFHRPTERPDEPITAGLSSGPGSGPEALGLAPNDTLAVLRAAYQLHPSRDLLRLILDEQATRGT